MAFGSRRTGLPVRGQTYYKGETPPTSWTESTPAEGTQVTFKDMTVAGAVGADTPRSNNDVLCKLVRNVAGFTLATKRLVSWASGYYGRRVDGYCDLDWDACAAGVVDEYLSGGCPANDMCWIAVEGPTLMTTALAADVTNVIGEGVDIAALTGAASNSTTSGRVQALVLTSAVTAAQQQVRGIIGRALSAKTTANTDVDILVHLQLLKA